MRNIENTSLESLIQKLAESKGTGKERPGKPPESYVFYSNSKCSSASVLCVNKRAVKGGETGLLPVPAPVGRVGVYREGQLEVKRGPSESIIVIC